MNQADWLRKRLRSAKKLGCAPEIGAALLVTVALAAAAGRAWAVDPGTGGTPGGPSTQKGLPEYLADLGGDDDAERLFAARTVRGELRAALAATRHGNPESLAVLEAQSVLVEIDARAPEACRVALTYANTAAPCAEILADLGHRELIAEIAAAKGVAPSVAAKRRIEVALEKLSGPGSDTLAPPTASGSPPHP